VTHEAHAATGSSDRLVALRLYFARSARAAPTRFWHHLSAPALGHHLLTLARRDGIEQALFQSVQAGYLPGESISYEHPEHLAGRHPACVELISTEERLRRFLDDHASHLLNVRVVLFRCEVMR
jgi:PII-like signaling protein